MGGYHKYEVFIITFFLSHFPLFSVSVSCLTDYLSVSLPFSLYHKPHDLSEGVVSVDALDVLGEGRGSLIHLILQPSTCHFIIVPEINLHAKII